MRELYKDITKHIEESKVARKGGENLHTGILKEMDRIKQINAIEFSKGDHYEYEEQDYAWLIQKLAATPDSAFYGCPINVPETVLFINSKPAKVIKTTREDNQVNQIRGGMGWLELRKYLQQLVSDRNRDYQRKLQ